MNRVVSIHLKGNTFQVEEQGYATLQTYLEEARRQLAGDPDIDEVLLDV